MIIETKAILAVNVTAKKFSITGMVNIQYHCGTCGATVLGSESAIQREKGKSLYKAYQEQLQEQLSMCRVEQIRRTFRYTLL